MPTQLVRCGLKPRDTAHSAAVRGRAAHRERLFAGRETLLAGCKSAGGVAGGLALGVVLRGARKREWAGRPRLE